jgi:DNA-binding transcriptional regulator YdaS (Cro superfamily)
MKVAREALRTVLSSRYMVLDRKSMPMVACQAVRPFTHEITWQSWLYLICVVKAIVHEACNQRGLADCQHDTMGRLSTR